VQTPRQAATRWDRGRVRQTLDVAFTEIGMYLLKSPSRIFENLENFRKFKKCWKLSEKRTKPIFFEYFEKLNVKFFKYFWFCALLGQFPAFFDFLKFFKNSIT
jgi:hypothetical protein